MSALQNGQIVINKGYINTNLIAVRPLADAVAQITLWSADPELMKKTQTGRGRDARSRGAAASDGGSTPSKSRRREVPKQSDLLQLQTQLANLVQKKDYSGAAALQARIASLDQKMSSQPTTDTAADEALLNEWVALALSVSEDAGTTSGQFENAAATI